MFGKNPIRKRVDDPENLAVMGHFYTIQGEGPLMGRPCVFIRLAGCNLACTFCDTEFEQGSVTRPTTELVKEIAGRYTARQRALVIITGGEPLRQNLQNLCAQLLETGTSVIQIETAGTLSPGGALMDQMLRQGRVLLVCSPKTPEVHPAIRFYCQHWKYIVKAGQVDHEGLPNYRTQPGQDGIIRIARPWCSEGSTYDPGVRMVWLSPCDEYDTSKNARNVAEVRNQALQHGYGVSLQMHKALGVE